MKLCLHACKHVHPFWKCTDSSVPSRCSHGARSREDHHLILLSDCKKLLRFTSHRGHTDMTSEQMPEEIFLPRELVDCIIRYLVSDVDKSSLLACIRLSRHWHASAFPALFHQIILRSDGKTHDTFTKFSRRAPPADKAHLVKTLIVVCQQPVGLRSNSINTYELCLILSKFPAIHSLSIIEANLVWSSRQFRGWSRQSIVDLRLSQVQVQMSDWIAGVTPLKCSLNQFLLEVFDSIHVLHLSGVQFRSAFGHNSIDWTPRIDASMHPRTHRSEGYSFPSVHKLVLPLWLASRECIAATQLLRSVHLLDRLHSLQLNQDPVTTRTVLSILGHTVGNLEFSVNVSRQQRP